MPLALVLSSFVAASRIGGAAQQYVLAAHRIDPVLAPTVLLGRSPAKGAKGEVTSPEAFARMLADIEADAVFGLADLFLTGHFSSAEQVEIAAGVIERVRATDRDAALADKPVVVVDPIMGDAPKGLYVKPEVARAVADRLVPNADFVTPNLWELAFLSGREAPDAAAARAAALSLEVPTLVTSVPARPDEIGLLYVDGRQAVLFAHPRTRSAFSGAGDLVAASFGAALVKGLAPVDAAAFSARVAAEVVQAAGALGTDELPIVALAERLINPTAELRVETIR